jgi:threonine aldolase
VVFFDSAASKDFEFLRKRGGHLFSKMRLLSAQLDAYFADGLWLANARHANAMARRLVAGLTPLKGTALLYPVDANEIFVVLPSAMHDALQAAGAQYHPWPSDRPGERAFRLVTAFDTDPADVDRFLSIAGQA